MKLASFLLIIFTMSVTTASATPPQTSPISSFMREQESLLRKAKPGKSRAELIRRIEAEIAKKMEALAKDRTKKGKANRDELIAYEVALDPLFSATFYPRPDPSCASLRTEILFREAGGTGSDGNLSKPARTALDFLALACEEASDSVN